jgi:hypothetical protein
MADRDVLKADRDILELQLHALFSEFRAKHDCDIDLEVPPHHIGQRHRQYVVVEIETEGVRSTFKLKPS